MPLQRIPCFPTYLMRAPRNSEVAVAYEVTVLRFHQIVPSLSLARGMLHSEDAKKKLGWTAAGQNGGKKCSLFSN